METNLQIFTNKQFGDVRTILEGDEILFVAADVCKALDHSNTAMALKALDADEKGISNVYTLGGKQKMSVVTEAGLYRLIFMSRKPNAKEFQRWIFHEVIPAIRKHGAYMTPATIEKVFNDPDFIINLAQQLKKERAEKAALQMENTALAQQVEGLKPKASYCEWVISASGTVPTTTIAKDYGMTAKDMNKLLHELGVQFKFGGTWYLYQEYAAKGWAVSKTAAFTHKDGTPDTRVYTVWTQKGRLGIYELLKHNGYIPIMERQHAADEDDVEETLWF